MFNLLEESKVKNHWRSLLGMQTQEQVWFGTIPGDVVEKILILLPTRDLIQCRVVCKEWDTLISSGRFIKLLCYAHDKHINTLTSIQVDFLDGIFVQDGFLNYNVKNNSWTTIWEKLVATIC